MEGALDTGGGVGEDEVGCRPKDAAGAETALENVRGTGGGIGASKLAFIVDESRNTTRFRRSAMEVGMYVNRR